MTLSSPQATLPRYPRIRRVDRPFVLHVCYEWLFCFSWLGFQHLTRKMVRKKKTRKKIIMMICMLYYCWRCCSFTTSPYFACLLGFMNPRAFFFSLILFFPINRQLGFSILIYGWEYWGQYGEVDIWSKNGKGMDCKIIHRKASSAKNFELGPLFPSFPPFTSRIRDICFLFFSQLLFDSLVIVSFFLNWCDDR